MCVCVPKRPTKPACEGSCKEVCHTFAFDSGPALLIPTQHRAIATAIANCPAFFPDVNCQLETHPCWTDYPTWMAVFLKVCLFGGYPSQVGCKGNQNEQCHSWGPPKIGYRMGRGVRMLSAGRGWLSNGWWSLIPTLNPAEGCAELDQCPRHGEAVFIL